MATSRKFDDPHWHWNGKYPTELLPQDEDANPPPIAHIAFFLVWAIDRGLASTEHDAADSPEVAQLRARTITPWEYVQRRVVDHLDDEDFNERGRAFANVYYRKGGPVLYFSDYCRVFDEEETGYHVADTWHNYDRLKPELDAIFEQWQEDGTIDE